MRGTHLDQKDAVIGCLAEILILRVALGLGLLHVPRGLRGPVRWGCTVWAMVLPSEVRTHSRRRPGSPPSTPWFGFDFLTAFMGVSRLRAPRDTQGDWGLAPELTAADLAAYYISPLKYNVLLCAVSVANSFYNRQELLVSILQGQGADPSCIST